MALGVGHANILGALFGSGGGGEAVLNRLNGTFPDAVTCQAGLTVSANGATITAGGLTVTAGGLTVSAGATSFTGGVTVVDTGLTVTAGGLTVTAGGLTVSASGAAITGNSSVAGQLTTTDGVASGTARRIGGVAARSVAASTAITGATETETNFDQTYTMPANTLKAGTVVRIRAQGIHTATTGAETHTILLKLGSTTIASKAAVDPADNDIFYFDFMLVCRTDGATGTVVGAGTMATGANGTAAVTGVMLASTTVDTTAAQVIAVAIDRQATATDSDSARLDVLVVEVIG